MDFTLEIHFTGLCAIIPERDISDPLNEATVVLVNAQNSPHGTHRSILLVDSACYIEPETTIANEPRGNRQAGSELSFDGGKRRGFVLDGEELMILARDALEPKKLDPLGNNSLRFTVGNRPYPPRPCPTQDKDDKDFTWVAKNPGAIDPAILTSVDLGYLISARTRLGVGIFETEKFRSTSQGLVRWWFEGAESVALAEQVVWKKRLPDTIGGITIASAPFRGYSQQLSLHLKPSSATIRVWIINMPLEDVLKLNQPPRPFDPDHHYEEYYRLCTWAPSFPIPHPDRSNFCPRVTAASNPKCPPTYFAPLTFQNAISTVSMNVPNVEALHQHGSDESLKSTNSVNHKGQAACQHKEVEK